MKKIIILFLVFTNISFAQKTFTIQGHFPNFANSNYELKGYEGMQTKVLSTAQSKADGKFVLNYPENYVGVAQLYRNGAYQNLLFLNKENINLFWEDLTSIEAMQLTNSKEHDAFVAGMKNFQDAEAKLAGLNYLVPLYAKDSIKQQVFIKELDTINNLFPNYVKSLPETIWVRHYLLARGLTEQMPTTAKTYTWRAPQHVAEFMAIDFKALQHAGLYKGVMEGYTYLVERFPLEEVAPLLNQAIDKVVLELKGEPTILQEIAQHWFTFLESHSLFESAEYLALKMLNDEACMLSEKNTALFEQYRKLANGNTAPDIHLGNGKTLLGLNNKYKLVVFGASWCPTCQTEYTKLKEMYKNWNAKHHLEIIYISIDTDKAAFEKHYKDAPFITYCDAKGWETQAAKDYFVHATPTYILLDKKLKIEIKIKNPAHLEAWLQANANNQ